MRVRSLIVTEGSLRNAFIWCLVGGLLLQILPVARMTIASYVVLACLLVLGRLIYVLTRDLVSPQMIFCLSWGGALFLTSLDVQFVDRVSHFNREIEPKTWLIFAAVTLLFLVGASAAMLPLRKCEAKNYLSMYQDYGKLDGVVVISFSIAFVVYCYAFLKNGGLPAFATDVNTSRSSFIPGTLGVFLILFQLVVVATTLKIIHGGVRGNLFAILLSLTAIVLTFLTTQRVGAIETVLMSGILTLSLWSYVSAEQRMRYKTPLFVGGLIFVGLFVWGFIYVGQLRGLQELQLTDLDNVFVEQLYIYFGGPAPRNFQMVLDGGVFSGSQSERYGALFFRSILWFIGFRDEVLVNDTFKGPNNATALFHYYVDFGLVGVFIFPLFWGAVCGLVYGCFRRKPTLRTSVLHAILATAVYFFPLSERFSEPSTFIKVCMFMALISVIQSVRFNSPRRAYDG